MILIQPPTEFQNWSMDTLEDLHMYNTVENHFESHKESRKGHDEMIEFLCSETSNAYLSIFSFPFSDNISWHVCCTCAKMHTWHVQMHGVLNFASKSTVH